MNMTNLKLKLQEQESKWKEQGATFLFFNEISKNKLQNQKMKLNLLNCKFLQIDNIALNASTVANCNYSINEYNNDNINENNNNNYKPQKKSIFNIFK